MYKRRFLAAILVCLLFPVSAMAGTDDFLYDGECFVEPNGEKGPWVYESDDMTVTVSRKNYTNRASRAYTVADVVCGDILFRSGAAKDNEAFRSTEQPIRIARRNRAILGITGDYIMHTINYKGVMIRNGKVFYDRKDSDTLAMLPEGKLAVYPAGSVTAQELLDMGVKDSWAFGPILIMDGEPYAPALNHYLASSNRRCSFGMIEAGHYIVIATNGYFTNKEMQNLFLEYGVELAYSMDGGHSTVMVFMGEQLNAHERLEDTQLFQRSLEDMLLLGQSDIVPSIDAPVRYRNVILGE